MFCHFTPFRAVSVTFCKTTLYSDWCVPVNMCSAGTECSFREKMHLYFTKLYDKNNLINTPQPHDAYSTCNWIRNENLNTEKPMLYFILTLIVLVVTLIVYLMWSEGEPALYVKQFKPSKVKISTENLKFGSFKIHDYLWKNSKPLVRFHSAKLECMSQEDKKIVLVQINQPDSLGLHLPVVKWLMNKLFERRCKQFIYNFQRVKPMDDKIQKIYEFDIFLNSKLKFGKYLSEKLRKFRKRVKSGVPEHTVDISLMDSPHSENETLDFEINSKLASGAAQASTASLVNFDENFEFSSFQGRNQLESAESTGLTRFDSQYTAIIEQFHDECVSSCFLALTTSTYGIGSSLEKITRKRPHAVYLEQILYWLDEIQNNLKYVHDLNIYHGFIGIENTFGMADEEWEKTSLVCEFKKNEEYKEMKDLVDESVSDKSRKESRKESGIESGIESGKESGKKSPFATFSPFSNLPISSVPVFSDGPTSNFHPEIPTSPISDFFSQSIERPMLVEENSMANAISKAINQKVQNSSDKNTTGGFLKMS